MAAPAPQSSRETAPSAKTSAQEPGADQLDGQWIHRRYYGKPPKASKYPFPIDYEECTRLDICHKVFLVATDDSMAYLDYAMPKGRKHRILDLGTGTGIWAINVIEERPGTEVVAVDFNGIQPQNIPRGMSTQHLDIEEPSWNLAQDFDFAHLRLLYGSIQTDLWPDIYRNVYKHLTAETGWIQHSEVDFTPKWHEGGDIPDPSKLKRWSDEYLKGLDERGQSGRVDSARTKRQLAEAGFVDITEETVQCAVNPWSSGKAYELGRWTNLMLVSGFEAMSMRPMCGDEEPADRMSVDSALALCNSASTEVCVIRYRAYLTIHIWKGRKPKGG